MYVFLPASGTAQVIKEKAAVQEVPIDHGEGILVVDDEVARCWK